MAAQPAERVYNFQRFSARSAAAPQLQEQKKNNVVELPQKELQKSRRHRVRPLRAVARIVCVLGICLVLANIVYGQVQLTELNDQIREATAQLEEARSVELQLQYTADRGMSAAELEAYAVSHLGMQKINPGQITYIEMADGNGGSVVQDVAAGPWYVQIWNAVLELLS